MGERVFNWNANGETEHGTIRQFREARSVRTSITFLLVALKLDPGYTESGIRSHMSHLGMNVSPGFDIYPLSHLGMNVSPGFDIYPDEAYRARREGVTPRVRHTEKRRENESTLLLQNVSTRHIHPPNVSALARCVCSQVIVSVHQINVSPGLGVSRDLMVCAEFFLDLPPHRRN